MASSVNVKARVRTDAKAASEQAWHSRSIFLNQPVLRVVQKGILVKSRVSWAIDLRLIRQVARDPSAPTIVVLAARRFVLDLQFRKATVAQQYYELLVQERAVAVANHPVDQRLLDAFDAADTDHSGGLDIHEVAALLTAEFKMSGLRREVEARVA
jgi:hypothetical protein